MATSKAKLSVPFSVPAHGILPPLPLRRPTSAAEEALPDAVYVIGNALGA
jgi:hypothetical protein